MPELTGSIVPGSGIESLPYPGRIVKVGERDKDIVMAVQQRLNESGCGPIEVIGTFGPKTEKGVKLFQARFPDADGSPLRVDGEIGSLTWARLFGTRTVPVTNVASSDLLKKVIEVARTQIGVMEVPPGSNRGPQVDKYITTVGLSPTGRFAWCAAFVFWCFDQAATELGRRNPVVKTGGVLAHWSKAGAAPGATRITNKSAVDNPSLIKPGHIFVMDFGGGAGHTGLVEAVTGGKLMTIEGNSNDGGSREGIGVFRRSARKVASINKGFIEYA